MVSAAVRASYRQPLSPDRELLVRLERGSVFRLPEQCPKWPDKSEPSALYLAVALTVKARSIVAPADVIARLDELQWTRGQALRKDRAAGVCWLDFGRIKRSVKRRAVEQFSETVLKGQVYGCRGVDDAACT